MHYSTPSGQGTTVWMTATPGMWWPPVITMAASQPPPSTPPGEPTPPVKPPPAPTPQTPGRRRHLRRVK